MKKISERRIFDGNWLMIYESVYQKDGHGEIVWESVRRKKCTSGVVLIARLMPSKRYILVKQFRPAVGGRVLAFPAGLAYGDPAHALVELKEETGYIGHLVETSPMLKTGSSIIHDTGQIVLIDVDENDPANQNPQQELEPGEDIEVCLTSFEEAETFFQKEMAQGTHIAGNLWYFFILPKRV